MAKVYLESTDTAFTVSNNNTTVYGANGDQVVTVTSGVTGVTYDQGIERIVFAGATSSYTYIQAGNSILVYSGTTLVATIPTQGDTDGTKLTFTDGTVSAINTAGVMALGGVTVSSTAAAAVTPTTIDTTVKSTVTGGTSTVTGNEAAVSYVLTTAQDTPVGGSTDEYFRAVAGSANGTQDQTTLNSSDIVDGGAGNDTLIVNLTGGSYAGGARIKNIETLQIGTNDTTARTFDYNVNMGTNEISEVTTVRYDQINTGEELSVNNILKTGTAIPTILWDNEASSTAGDINIGFRTSTTDGSSTSLTVQLDDVIADVNTATTGQLDIASGVESLTVNSQGSSTRNTLNASDNTTTNGVAADLASGTASSLTSVTLTGSKEIGKAATVITTTTDAEYGYTNRAVGSDLGIENADSSVKGTASNLLSVAASVTTLDASAMTAATSVRFTNYTDGTTKDVTYKGGTAADYVEFEAGKVTATGGEGADTFAFINANTARSGFDSTDVITGGAGSDAIQLGVNGVGTYTLNTTEFNNKSGIDALDLRGNTNTITLSDNFVSSADTGTTFTVYTDKIIQTSDTSTANPSGRVSGNNYIEDNVVTVLDATALAQNRALKFAGGSGSDQLIMDNESYNQYVTLAGGTNAGNNGATTTAGDLDTLTIVNGANLDAGDLANTSGFEGMLLVDTTNGSQSYQITLTEAFLLANTASSDTSSTTHDERAFYIATDAVASTGGAVLTTGDKVQIDITDLLVSGGTAIKTSLSGRYADVSSIEATAATVEYIYNGTTLTNTDAKALLATGNTADDTAATAGVANIVGNDGVAAGTTSTSSTTTGTTGNTFTLAATNAILTNAISSSVTAAVTGTYLTAYNDTIVASTNLSNAYIVDSSATDTDTLSATITGGAITAPTITNIETLNITTNQSAASSLLSVTGATTINISGATSSFTDAQTQPFHLASGYSSGLTANVTTVASQGIKVTLNGTATGAGVTTNSTTTSTTTPAIALTVAANSTLSTLDTAAATATINVSGAGNLTVADATTTGTVNASTMTGTLTFSDVNATIITGSAQADSFTQATAGAASVNGGAGNDAFVFGTTGTLTTADSVNGGDGTDTITTSGYTTTTDLANVTNVEVLNLTGSSLTYSYTLVDTVVAMGQTLTVNASGATGTSTLTFNGAAETNGVFNITGSLGADSITGGSNSDTITGGLGADTITGGAGNDTISLTETTAAVDVLYYAESGTAKVDTVTGFTAGSDFVKFSYGNIDGVVTYNFASAGGTDVNAIGTTAATVVVNTSAAVADGAELLVFSSTAATSFATAIGTAVITDTTGTNWTNATSIAAVYYDATNSQAVYGYIADTTAAGTAITSADTFTEIVRVGMTSTDYTAANAAASFDFLA